MSEIRYVVTLSLVAFIFTTIFTLSVVSLSSMYIRHILRVSEGNVSTGKGGLPSNQDVREWKANTGYEKKQKEDWMDPSRRADHDSLYVTIGEETPHYSFYYDMEEEKSERAFDFRSPTWPEEYEQLKKTIELQVSEYVVSV